jgi:hypothetical protein
MQFLIVMFHSLINLTINKYTSYIIVLQCWNTEVSKHPTLKVKWPLLKANSLDPPLSAQHKK